jgi:hypothetical protein
VVSWGAAKRAAWRSGNARAIRHIGQHCRTGADDRTDANTHPGHDDSSRPDECSATDPDIPAQMNTRCQVDAVAHHTVVIDRGCRIHDHMLADTGIRIHDGMGHNQSPAANGSESGNNGRGIDDDTETETTVA